MRTIVLSVVLIIFCSSFAFLRFSTNKIVNVKKTIFQEKTEAFLILDEIAREMQNLKNEVCDKKTSEVLSNIKNKYAQYALEIKDVSSGINKNFCPDAIVSKIENEELNLSEECFVDYGWMNEHFKNTKGHKMLKENFSQSQNLFPYINKLPLVNIYQADEKLLRFILREGKIKNEKKIDLFFEKLKSEKFNSVEEIYKTLGVDSKSLIACFLGVKTTFYKITFTYNERCKIFAIMCAIPSQENQNKIEEYKVIKKGVAGRS